VAFAPGDEKRLRRRAWAAGVAIVTSFVSHTTVDCRDAYTLAAWWREVLGYMSDPDDPDDPGDEECLIMARDRSHRVLFVQVPEAKQVKNRVHFDLRPREGTRDEELARLLAHGATEVEDFRRPDGTGWVLLADPEGNEFCILRSEAEVAATTA
jgi:hypothetical protein